MFLFKLMKLHIESESLDSIIERQLKLWEAQKAVAEKKMAEKPEANLIVTFSRMLGAQGEEVAVKLSELIHFQLLDREIIEAIAGDSGVQTKIVELLDEKTQSELEMWIKGTMAGKMFGTSDYLKSLTKTVGSVMKHGKTILVGRGTNIILGPQRGFRVRIVASLETRTKKIAELKGVSLKGAEKMVRESDKNRENHIKKTFGVDINDPETYDITLNTDTLSVDDTVELVLLGFNKKKVYLSKQPLL